jgi:hypothetical protein
VRGFFAFIFTFSQGGEPSHSTSQGRICHWDFVDSRVIFFCDFLRQNRFKVEIVIYRDFGDFFTIFVTEEKMDEITGKSIGHTNVGFSSFPFSS